MSLLNQVWNDVNVLQWTVIVLGGFFILHELSNIVVRASFRSIAQSFKSLSKIIGDDQGMVLAKSAIETASIQNGNLQEINSTMTAFAEHLNRLNDIQDKNYEWVKRAIENNESLAKKNRELINAINRETH